MSIAQRLTDIQAEIKHICKEVDRPYESVGLIAVSKRHTVNAILEARATGQLDFGENFAQELRDKAREVAPPIHWHFIGRIQRNKAKYIANSAWRVHCLETVEQAEALASRANNELSCLVGVNIGREQQKSGVLPEQLLDQVQQLSKVPNIRLTGLMCLPPQVEQPEQTTPYFEEMQNLLNQIQQAGHESMNELSMGMSSDFRLALRYGATWIRVGSAIFGPRPTKG